MSSGLDLRKRGKRQDPGRSAKAPRPSPLTAIDAGSPGEIRISNDTMMALHHLYQTSPSIQAARAILMGQLLSSGCVVRRSGRDVNLKDISAALSEISEVVDLIEPESLEAAFNVRRY